jgi:hypothetical protein
MGVSCVKPSLEDVRFRSSQQGPLLLWCPFDQRWVDACLTRFTSASRRRIVASLGPEHLRQPGEIVLVGDAVGEAAEPSSVTAADSLIGLHAPHVSRDTAAGGAAPARDPPDQWRAALTPR